MDPSYPNPNRKLLLNTFFVFVAIVFWVWVNSPMIITVSGTGEVSAAAETATVSFTLSSSDNSPQSAVTSVSDKAVGMRTFLLTKGIAEGDIAQSQVTAVPASLVTTGSSGFQATINMAVKTTHVSSVSDLISELYANGALVVSQPVLSVGNQRELEAQALASAMKEAKSQGSNLALKNWKFIRKIISITQSTSANTSTATTKADALTENTSAIAAQNGVFKIVKGVTLTYKLW